MLYLIYVTFAMLEIILQPQTTECYNQHSDNITIGEFFLETLIIDCPYREHFDNDFDCRFNY